VGRQFMQSGVVVRRATLDDVKGIVEVHCSGVSKWYRFLNGVRVEAEYDELSVADKWAHGGPWMSVETCAVHLNYVLTSKQYPLVAVLGGRVVGELELYIGFENSVLGKHGWIDVLEVHREYRGRGVGRKLVEKAREIAVEEGCDTLAVWPDPSATGFYRKLGFDKTAFRVKYVKLDLTSVKPAKPEDLGRVAEFPESYDVLSDWLYVSLRNTSSYVAWLKSRWSYAVEDEVLKSVKASIDGDAALVIKGVWGEPSEASLYLWVKDRDLLLEALEKAASIARYMGFSGLKVSMSSELCESVCSKYKCEVLEEFTVLYQDLRSRPPSL